MPSVVWLADGRRLPSANTPHCHIHTHRKHLPASCRRAESFQLGPLLMERPLFMELPCSGIVTGVPDGGRVVGIVG